tara:strand:+ start:1741 stop:2640 length:900 start_codon:yes stop_codon:yes gene_type:complete
MTITATKILLGKMGQTDAPLRFSSANTKLAKMAKNPEVVEHIREKLAKIDCPQSWHKRAIHTFIYSFDLLSGYSCPGAKDCLSRAIVDEQGKRSIQDGNHTRFRCFSASQETQYNGVFAKRAQNFATLRAVEQSARGKGKREAIAARIQAALPDDALVVRIHVSGDFFSQAYWLAWLQVARDNPHRTFYCYTKQLKLWTGSDHIPRNLILTASRGGRWDNLIAIHNLREARVILSENDENRFNRFRFANSPEYRTTLPIDTDDSHAMLPGRKRESFCLLIHGTQPPDSAASRALSALSK